MMPTSPLPSASYWRSSRAAVVHRRRPTCRTASLAEPGRARRGLRLSSGTYVSSRLLGFTRSGLEGKSVLVQEGRPRSGEVLCRLRDVGAGHQVVAGPNVVWRVLRAPASYRADRARARPTATATEKTATANRAQIPQSTSRRPMTAADMEVASYAPEIARSAQ